MVHVCVAEYAHPQIHVGKPENNLKILYPRGRRDYMSKQEVRRLGDMSRSGQKKPQS